MRSTSRAASASLSRPRARRDALRRALPARLHEERERARSPRPAQPGGPRTERAQRREPRPRRPVVRPCLVEASGEREGVGPECWDSPSISSRTGAQASRFRVRRPSAMSSAASTPSAPHAPRAPCAKVRRGTEPHRGCPARGSRLREPRSSTPARTRPGRRTAPRPAGRAPRGFRTRGRCGGWTWRDATLRTLSQGVGTELEVSPARRAAAWLPVVIWLGVVIVFSQGSFSADWSLRGMGPLARFFALTPEQRVLVHFFHPQGRARRGVRRAGLPGLPRGVGLPSCALAPGRRRGCARPLPLRRVSRRVAPVLRDDPHGRPARRRDRPRARCRRAPGVAPSGPPPG